MSRLTSLLLLKVSLAALLGAMAYSTAHAGPHYGHGYRHGHHHHGHYRGGYGWAPWVGGALVGAVVYDMYNRPVVVQQPPVVVEQQPVIVQQPQQVTVQRTPQCTPWTETRNPDGTITATRTCQ